MTRTFLAAHGDSGDQPGSRDVFSRSKTDPTRLKIRVLQTFGESKDDLYRYLLCLNLRPEKADDMIQETFLRLHQHLAVG
jgi:hypothetical protein